MVARLWPQLRALLVGLHVLIVILLATPSPGAGMRRSAWKDPTVQEEFQAWTDRLNRIGLKIRKKTLEDRLWDFAVGWETRRGALLAPARPYARYLGTDQAWRMFVAPHRYPTRLSVDVHVGDAWRLVYEERSPTATWLGWVFDHDRARSLIFRFGWSHYRRPYEQFARWVAQRAAADFPEADRARVRMFKYRTQSPEEVRSGAPVEGRYQQEQLFDLAELRAEAAP